MSFRIGGVGADGKIWTTRLQAANALTVALRWLEAGMREVVIVDKHGRQHTLDEFRARQRSRSDRDRPVA